ncbi:MAG TPA: hypothetical protein VII74_03210 [Chthoniobacterales bacterium]
MSKSWFGRAVFLLLAVALSASAGDNSFQLLREALRKDLASHSLSASGRPVNRNYSSEEALLSALPDRAGDDASRAENILKQLLASDLPPSLRKEAEKALARMHADEDAREKAYAGQVAAALGRAQAALAKAKKPQDLDDTLAEIQKLYEWARTHGEGPLRIAETSGLERAEYSVRSWQDYLWDVDGGKVAAAISLLHTLSDSASIGPPRSEILDRIRALETEADDDLNARAIKILQSIKSIDELPAALAQFHSDQNFYRVPGIATTMTNLDALCKIYLAFKEGIATPLPGPYSTLGDKNQLVARLTSSFLLQAVPRILGTETKDPPKPGETLEEYLARVKKAALQANDWDLLGRALLIGREISMNIGGHIVDNYTLHEDDAFLSFREGQNDERAKRYLEATLAYRQALRMGREIPAEFIGERLASIEREHPADYEAALNMVRRNETGPRIPEAHSPRDHVMIPAAGPKPPAAGGGSPKPSPPHK